MQFLAHTDTAESASGSARPMAPALGWLDGWMGELLSCLSINSRNRVGLSRGSTSLWP